MKPATINILEDYCANLASSYDVAEVFCISINLQSILQDMQDEIDAIECDAEGATWEQLNAMDDIYRKYCKIIRNVKEIARIKQRRISNNITLAQLSDMSGIPISNISRIEKGQIYPRIDTLAKLATALNITITLS